MQQIAISGVGGQGVLFITKVLAETAVALGHSVLISETHGMAQRGGNVISHLKIGWRTEPENPASNAGTAFVSPLIRPGRADVLLALHPDGIISHGFYLKPGGYSFYNSSQPEGEFSVDATAIAAHLGAPICANLVLLGFAAGSHALFCTPENVIAFLTAYGGKRLQINLKAFQAGLDARHRQP